MGERSISIPSTQLEEDDDEDVFSSSPVSEGDYFSCDSDTESSRPRECPTCRRPFAPSPPPPQDPGPLIREIIRDVLRENAATNAPLPSKPVIPERQARRVLAYNNSTTTMPSLALSLDDRRCIPFYVLAVSPSRVCFFVSSTMDVINKSRAEMPLPGLEPGHIYHISGLNRSYLGAITTPSAMTRRKYTDRNEFVCEDPAAYRRVILQSLLLGCRVRDYEQRCAIVTMLGGEMVEVRMPSPGRRLDELSFKTISGETFEVTLEGYRVEDDVNTTWLVMCRVKSLPLPSSVVLWCHLEIVNVVATQSPVAQALFNCSSGQIDNWSLLSCIYGEQQYAVDPTVAIGLLRTDPQIRLANGADVIRLNAQQVDAVARYNCDAVPAVVIEAPPGSGKTLTAAAMAVSYRGKGVQLFLSTANVPVFNIAFALEKLDYGSRRPIHLCSSEGLEKMDEMRSPFSSLSLAKKQVERRERVEYLEDQLQAAEEGSDDERLLRKALREIGEAVAAEEHDIYLATVDFVLKRLFKPNQYGNHVEDTDKRQLSKNVRRVVVDEASQLTEAALNALILCFPKAQIVLIGDSKQLPPYKCDEGSVVSRLAARSALDVLKDKRNVTVIELRSVYRAPSSIIRHYNRSFYGGSLRSEKQLLRDQNPLACLDDRGGGRRCVFWKVVNGVSKQEGTSKFNYKELNALTHLVHQLGLVGITQRDIMIICYYEAQRKMALSQENLPAGYEVLTVDSAQGREKKVVIVLTTRSSLPTNPDEVFFNCPKRCNVAVSRHQEALIVLGHPCIGDAPNWSQVLSPNYFHHYEDHRGGSNLFY